MQQHASTWRLDWSNFLVSLAKSSGSLHGIGRFQLLLQPLKLFRCCCLVTRPWLGANIKTCTMPQYLVNSLVLRDWSSKTWGFLIMGNGYIRCMATFRPESLWCSQPLVQKFYMYRTCQRPLTAMTIYYGFAAVFSFRQRTWRIMSRHHFGVAAPRSTTASVHNLDWWSIRSLWFR